MKFLHHQTEPKFNYYYDLLSGYFNVEIPQFISGIIQSCRIQSTVNYRDILFDHERDFIFPLIRKWKLNDPLHSQMILVFHVFTWLSVIRDWEQLPQTNES